MILCDTHSHLDYPDFKDDLEKTIERALNANVKRIITVGTDLESSRRAIAISENYDNVYAAAGWHPSFADRAPEEIATELEQLAKHPKVVAIGETGLDYYRLPSLMGTGTPESDKKVKLKQSQIFKQQLEVAARSGLNCIIHQREAFDDVLEMIKPYAGKIRVVFHCFTENSDILNRVLDIGALVSFTGIITFKNAESVRETLYNTPLDRFMLETDAPFLAPVPHRGKRCEPAYVAHTAEVASMVKNCSIEEIARATTETAASFFYKMKL